MIPSFRLFHTCDFSLQRWETLNTFTTGAFKAGLALLPRANLQLRSLDLETSTRFDRRQNTLLPFISTSLGTTIVWRTEAATRLQYGSLAMEPIPRLTTQHKGRLSIFRGSMSNGNRGKGKDKAENVAYFWDIAPYSLHEPTFRRNITPLTALYPIRWQHS
jgi:hypothetical protein